jgi:hypothetical protein
MIQELFLAMQGDPRRFTSLRDKPHLFQSATQKGQQGPNTSRKEKGGRPLEMVKSQLRGLAATASSFEKAGLN